MKKLIGSLLLLGGSVVVLSAYASNPASKEYVDQEIKKLTATYTIGQHAQGGIIFYLDPSKLHGLAAATSDQSGTYKWDSNGSGVSTNALLQGIYLGKQNQASILDSADAAFSAAALACASTTSPAGGGGGGNSYLDWYLPSTTELALLSTNGVITQIAYWSSTEANSSMAYIFVAGVSTTAPKSATYSVRCIRSF